MVDRQFFFLIQQRDRLAHVQDAGDAVDFSFIHRQFVVVASSQLTLDFIDRHSQVQCFDLGARGHDVLD